MAQLQETEPVFSERRTHSTRSFSKVRNPDLRAYLTSFSKELPDQDFFRVDELIQLPFNLRPLESTKDVEYSIHRAQENFRRHKIISHKVSLRGKQHLVSYDHEETVAIAAILWQTNHRQFRISTKDISMLLESLGEDSLKSIIMLPHQSKSPRFKFIEGNFPIKKPEPDAYKPPVSDDKSSVEISIPYSHISQISPEILREAAEWTPQALKKSAEIIKNRDSFGPASSRDIPINIRNILSNLNELKNHKTIDPDLVSNADLLESINLTLLIFRKNPKIRNLRKLVEVIKSVLTQA